MEFDLVDVAIWGYGVAAAACLLFALYLAGAWRGRAAGGLLLAAVGTSAVWAALSALVVAYPSSWMAQLGNVADVARGAGWFAFLLVLLMPAGARRARWPLFAAIAVVLIQLAAVVLSGFGVAFAMDPRNLMLPAFLGAATLGLVLVEQLFRGMPEDARWAVKPLCLGLAAGYMFELYMYADGFLFGRLDPAVWSVRGIVCALVLPLVALSAARNPSWALPIALSREMAFHSTALAASGLYLMVIAGAGYYVRYVGGTWGRALQVTLLFAGLLLLVVVLFSGSQRARLRVLLSKHLFPYRYDYRNEWLRFTAALSAGDGALDLGQSVIQALCDLVESPGGALWLADGEGALTMRARLNMAACDTVENEDSPFCRFLGEREWIVNLEEQRAGPARNQGPPLPTWLSALAGAWLVVPLKSAGALMGFVVLNAPRTPFEVDWEVLDLLKTAQRQAASYLARMQATEALLEARKFDSFNRMTAFVVHDLKNLVAQLALMLKNAQRHKDNPAFQADMLETVAHVEERMRALMRQLQEKREIDPARPVDLARLVERIGGGRRGQRPSVSCELGEAADMQVLAHPDRLERVIGHIVQNAVDATPPDGRVVMRLAKSDGHLARLEIEDTGCGMSEDFIRERLAKPFHTTKSSGMGIGVYETRQYVQELGGSIRFDSEERRGTRVTLVLPLVSRAAAPAGVVAEAETETEHHE